MARIEDLKAGQRVRVAKRAGGAIGVIDAPPIMDNSVTPPRPVVCIKFCDAGYGFNYPEQCEIIGG